MDRQPKCLIEQLQNIHLRQRKVIQQLQAENARLLSDLADVRRERDAFREKVALERRENVELRNKLEEALMEYQDLKRRRATPVRFVTTAVDIRRRNANLGCKFLDILPVLDEGENESAPTAETTKMKKGATRTIVQPQFHKDLPNPPKSKSPGLDHCMSTLGSQLAMARDAFQ